MDWLQDILLMFGTGGVTSIILRIIDRKSLTRQTLSVLTYSTLSGKVEHLLDQDYATPEQRGRSNIYISFIKRTAGMVIWSREWKKYEHCRRKI